MGEQNVSNKVQRVPQQRGTLFTNYKKMIQRMPRHFDHQNVISIIFGMELTML